MFRVFGTVSRKSASSRSNTRATKRSFRELGYFKPKYAEYGDDDFVEDDMYDSVESFQRDKGLKEDGVMREDGPTHHQANAELLKRRRKALDPDGSKGLRDSPGLGLESSVGRKATNKPSDVTKVKKALSAVNLYPSQRARINDGKADDDLQYGLDYMANKYAAGVQNGRVQKGSSAERNLYDIAGGNNVDYLSEALQGRIVKSRSNIRQLAEAAKKAKAEKSDNSHGSTLQALLSRMEGAEGQEGKLVAQALTLPSPNYVPKEVRSPDSNKTDDDDPNPNKDLEYDPSVLEQVFSGLVGRAHAAEPETEEADKKPAGKSSVTQEGKMDFSVVTKEGQKPLSRENPEEQGYTLTNASTTESETDDKPDSTHQGQAERKAVEQGEENHEVPQEQIKGKKDKYGKIVDYTHVTIEQLKKLYPDIKLPDDYDLKSFDEIAIFNTEAGPGYKIATNLYIPTDDDGNVIGDSGATIGFGLDLGQRDEAGLAELVKPGTPLYNKLKPYLGKTKKEAQKFLEKYPLELSEGEALALSRAAHGQIHKQIKDNYDFVWDEEKFAKLSKGVKTAIYSVGGQYGADLEEATPSFWAYALANDPESMIYELENFGDAHGKRRKEEAGRLKESLKKH